MFQKGNKFGKGRPKGSRNVGNIYRELWSKEDLKLVKEIIMQHLQDKDEWRFAAREIHDHVFGEPVKEVEKDITTHKEEVIDINLQQALIETPELLNNLLKNENG
jgi:hypothetical protein